MNIEEKEMIYFAQRKLVGVKSVLQIIKNDFVNSSSAMSERVISYALESVMDSIDSICNDMNTEGR